MSSHIILCTYITCIFYVTFYLLGVGVGCQVVGVVGNVVMVFFPAYTIHTYVALRATKKN